MLKDISKADFLDLTNDEVKKIVEEFGRPKTVEVIPDATRRTGILYENMKVSEKDFEKNVISTLNRPYMNLTKTIYDHGINTIVMPGLTHGNLNRGKKYVDSVIEFGLKSILTGKDWLDFYKEYDIRVNFYGDLDYLRSVTQKYGHEDVITWCDELQKSTRNNKSYRFFWGFACSNSIETFRIINLAIEFSKLQNRSPTNEELIEQYYGEPVDKIDIFIRPGEIRDSDCQPPLIGGNAQFYFPVPPLTELESDFFRKILYDYLYNRLLTFSKKQYMDIQLDENEMKLLRDYYDRNRNNIIGLGRRISHFWLPDID